MMQSIATTVGTIYLSTGSIRQMFVTVLLATPLVLGGIVAGLPFGIVGVAIGYGAASATIFYITVHLACRLVNLPPAEFFRALWRPFASALFMLAIVMLVGAAYREWSAQVRLGVLVGSGFVAYVLGSMMFNRRHILETARLVSLAILRRS
jgi:PST family polysaccharide transporter